MSSTSSIGPDVLRICEALCERLRHDVGLTIFRIELPRPLTPLVVTMHSSEPVRWSPERQSTPLGAPARLEFAIHGDDRVVARVEIDDAERSEYPVAARSTCDRIAIDYADALRALIREPRP